MLKHILIPIWSYVSQPDFHTNFFANTASDILLAILLTIIYTGLSRRREERKRTNEILGLLKTEISINIDRAQEYIAAIKSPHIDISTLFPFRYTRGVWNAVKESGFLQQIDDIRLIYLLLRMNEATLAATKNIRRYQLAILEPDNQNLELLKATSLTYSEKLLDLLQPTLELLNEQDLPDFSPEDAEFFKDNLKDNDT